MKEKELLMFRTNDLHDFEMIRDVIDSTRIIIDVTAIVKHITCAIGKERQHIFVKQLSSI